jgi:dihydroorotase
MRYDVLIRSGRVIDPANSVDGIFDVALENGLIAAVAEPGSIAEGDCAKVFDATGLLVMPGLVDAHAHGFKGIGFGQVDFDEQCLSRCTTTVVDAGSSGCTSFQGFREYIIEPAECRVLALLNISMIGCTALAPPAKVDPKTGKSSGGRKAGEFAAIGGNNQSLAYISASDAIDVIEANRDVIVGVKCLLTRQISGPDGENEPATYAAAQEAAAATGLPLMTHHSWSTISLEECPGNLRRGDIYTHCFHPYETTIMQTDTGGQSTIGRLSNTKPIATGAR